MAEHSPAPPLAGWYVISLRPSGQHAPLRRAAAARGARLFACATLALQPLPAAAALRAALGCPVVLFTSPAAVRFAQAQAPLRARPGQAWLAVGGGTAAALAAAGIDGVQAPARGGDSDALLALPALQPARLGGRPVGLVTAPGGRGLLAPTLRQRGAELHLAEVYRRLPQPPRAARLRALAALPPTSALLVSSGEAFDGLWSALDADGRERLRRRPAIASSERLAARLADAGFERVRVADGARPAALVSTLAAGVAQGRFR